MNDEPAKKEGQRLAGGIAEQPELQDRGGQRHGAGCGHRRRAVAAKRGSGRDLAADRHDVGQRLVEIAHLQRQTLLRPACPDRPITLYCKVYRVAKSWQVPNVDSGTMVASGNCRLHRIASGG
jgi:hypothetical protein